MKVLSSNENTTQNFINIILFVQKIFYWFQTSFTFIIKQIKLGEYSNLVLFLNKSGSSNNNK